MTWPPRSTIWPLLLSASPLCGGRIALQAEPGNSREVGGARTPRRRRQPGQSGRSLPRARPLRGGGAACQAESGDIREGARARAPRRGPGPNNLAYLYWRQGGRYAEAEPLAKRSLAIRERQLRPEHLDVAASLNLLASLYRDHGLYAQAEPLCQRSLAIREKRLGPEDPDVATASITWRTTTRDAMRRRSRCRSGVWRFARSGWGPSTLT